MTEPSLTKDEAEKFLELRRKVSEDMNTALSGSMESVDSGTDKSVFVEKYNGDAGSLYTDCVRNKYTSFVKKVYLSEND